MLKEIVRLIQNAGCMEADGTLFCKGVRIDENTRACIAFLDDHSVIENMVDSVKDGDCINLELALIRLNSLGYYQTTESLILKNPYQYPENLFFVAGAINQFSDDTQGPFFSAYSSVITFITSLKSIAKHDYTDVDVNYLLIFREDRSLLIPVTYTARQIEGLSEDETSQLNAVSNVLAGHQSEKKLLYINELVDHLSPVSEHYRFATLLQTVTDFADKAENAFQFYLRDFSYNKLKIELDAKALEYTQKIQGVINDSQNKLITIPTAFVLVFATFDFKEVDSVKNIIYIVSLFIFAVLIQIFLNNQNSALHFTEANIKAYKDTFTQNNLAKLQEKFDLVDNELSRQKTRLRIITWILWLLPVALLITWIILRINQVPQIK